MQQFIVQILPAAYEDLQKISRWYEWRFNKGTANKVINNILDTIERLECFPHSGSPTPDAWLNAKGYRSLICYKHVAIYRIINDIVYIYHIADTRTQYTKLIFE